MRTTYQKRLGLGGRECNKPSSFNLYLRDLDMESMNDQEVKKSSFMVRDISECRKVLETISHKRTTNKVPLKV